MKKLILLVAALMAVAFVGLNYERIAYANDRAIPSIGVSGGTDSISVVWSPPADAPYDYRLAWGLEGGYIGYASSNTSTAGNAYPGGSATSYTITGLDPGTYSVKLRARYDGSAGPWKAASSVDVTGDAPPVVVVVPDPTAEPTAEPDPPTSDEQRDSEPPPPVIIVDEDPTTEPTAAPEPRTSDEQRDYDPPDSACPLNDGLLTPVLLRDVEQHGIRVYWSSLGDGNTYDIRYTSGMLAQPAESAIDGLEPNKQGYLTIPTSWPCQPSETLEASVTGSSSGLWISGLAPATTYSVQVRRRGDDDGWTRAVSVTTDAVPVATPTASPTASPEEENKPVIDTMNCAPVTVVAGTSVTCTLSVSKKKSGYVQTWTASGAATETGTADTFTTSWADAGTKTVSLSVCNTVDGVEYCADSREVEIKVLAVLEFIEDVNCESAKKDNTKIALGVQATCKYESQGEAERTWSSSGADPATSQERRYQPQWATSGLKTVSVTICNELNRCITGSDTMNVIPKPVVRSVRCTPNPASWGVLVGCHAALTGERGDEFPDFTLVWSGATDEPGMISRAPDSNASPAEISDWYYSWTQLGQKTVSVTFTNAGGQATKEATIYVDPPTPESTPNPMTGGEVADGRGIAMPPGGGKLTLSIGDTVKRILPDPNRCINFHDEYKVYSQYRKIQEGRPTSNVYADYPIWEYWTLLYGRHPGTGENGNPGKETGLRVDYDTVLKKMVLHGTVTRSDGHIYPMQSSFEYGGVGWFSNSPLTATEVRSVASIACWADTQTWDIQINDPPTTPSVPGNALVVYGENEATLYWSHDQSDESALRFEIYRKAPGQSAYPSSPVHTTGENTTIWKDSERSRDNKAVYCVKAVHGTFKSDCSLVEDYADRS